MKNNSQQSQSVSSEPKNPHSPPKNACGKENTTESQKKSTSTSSNNGKKRLDNFRLLLVLIGFLIVLLAVFISLVKENRPLQIMAALGESASFKSVNSSINSVKFVEGIVQHQGNPVVNAQVVVFENDKRSGTTWLGSEKTQEDGKFRFALKTSLDELYNVQINVTAGGVWQTSFLHRSGLIILTPNSGPEGQLLKFGTFWLVLCKI